MKTNKLKSGLISISGIAAMLLVVLSVSFTVISCEGEDESGGGGCEKELMNLAEIVETRSTTFANSPTSSNCSALRTATINMINKAKACGQTGWDEQLAYWQNYDCSTFD